MDTRVDATEPDVATGAPPRVPLAEIARLFARIGITSFGGGLSAWMYREVVDRRRWLAEDAFLSGLTLGQIMPGANVVNLSVYIGQRLRGWLGSVVAVTALLLPPTIAVVVLGAVLQRFGEFPWLHDLLEGVAAGAIGLTFSVGFRAARHAASRGRWAPVLVFAVFGLVGLLRWPMIPVVLCLAPVGVALARRRR
jgi:chromate transporter